MKTMFYDLLPLNDGRYILRAASNGLRVLSSLPGESKAKFIVECTHYVEQKSTPERPARLRVYEEE